MNKIDLTISPTPEDGFPILDATIRASSFIFTHLPPIKYGKHNPVPYHHPVLAGILGIAWNRAREMQRNCFPISFGNALPHDAEEKRRSAELIASHHEAIRIFSDVLHERYKADPNFSNLQKFAAAANEAAATEGKRISPPKRLDISQTYAMGLSCAARIDKSLGF